jgi:hypothetical protein
LDNRKATLQAGETAYDVTSNVVSNAVVYKWIPIISLYDNAGLKEIVSGSFLCEEGKQGFGFIYDNKQYSVCINETEDGVSYEETLNKLGGTQSVDVPEYSISKDDKDGGTEYQLTKDGEPITGSESIFISKSIGTGDCDLESLKLEEDIIIKDGPLSKILNDADINTFKKGMNLLTELERNVLEYRFGVNDKKMLCVSDIQDTLNINWKELNAANKSGMDKLQNYWWSVI